MTPFRFELTIAQLVPMFTVDETLDREGKKVKDVGDDMVRVEFNPVTIRRDELPKLLSGVKAWAVTVDIVE